VANQSRRLRRTLYFWRPSGGVKDRQIRLVATDPTSAHAFDRLLNRNSETDKSDKVFKVRECPKATDCAARKVGMARIPHHNLRHFFPAVCIKSGVDIPTVSRWLGHEGGGALAMRTYGHLRCGHFGRIRAIASISAPPLTHFWR